jgi:hypothetical protein
MTPLCEFTHEIPQIVLTNTLESGLVFELISGNQWLFNLFRVDSDYGEED